MLIKAFFSSKNVLWLLCAFIVAMLILDIGGGDIWLASKLYALEGSTWSLQQHWLTETVLHKGARQVNYLFCSIVLFCTVYFSINWRKNKNLANSFIALSLSLISAFALVAYLKAITNIACPWDLSLFGGTEPYIHLLQSRPSYLPYNQCFPAGHASVGYAWAALFYFFRQVAPRWRFIGLATGLSLGLMLGLAQQLRGAHFISHDVTTLVLCILCAKFCFMLVTPDSTKTMSNQL
jgi:membrane-associated PAP2 superfamily phosphatase